VRFRILLTMIPPVAGVAVAIPLVGSDAEPEFFDAAAHVLAIGAVALALQGRFFRLAPHLSGGPGGAYAMINVITILVSTGIGLAAAFTALAKGHSGQVDVALTAGALASGVAAFAVQALFGTPGVADEPAS
jgi:hypothetical protein